MNLKEEVCIIIVKNSQSVRIKHLTTISLLVT